MTLSHPLRPALTLPALTLPALTLLLLLAHTAQAQSCSANGPTARDVTARFADATLFDDPGSGERRLAIDLTLTAALAFDLGGASLFFSYDDDALDFRRVVFSDFVTSNACYAALDRNDDATDAGQTALGLIINPFSCNPASGAAGSALTPGVPEVVATVEYAVVNPAAEASFVFTNAVSNDDEGQSCTTASEPFLPQQLPVELARFEGRADGRAAVLTWATESETNNAGFALERRGAGEVLWHEEGFVAGAGTTAERRRYALRVADLTPGRHVFRLRQVDFDGSVTLSAEVEVTVSVAALVALRVWPTPARAHASLQVSMPYAGMARLSVYDVLGREVLTPVDEVLAEGLTTRTVDTSALPSGLYVCRLRTAGHIVTHTLTVAR